MTRRLPEGDGPPACAPRAKTAAHPAQSWPTRPIRPVPSANTCGDAASVQSSRSRPIGGPVCRGEPVEAPGRPALTVRCTNGVTPSKRCVNRLEQWRGIATRYDKTATIYLAGLYVAGIFLWSARCPARNRPADAFGSAGPPGGPERRPGPGHQCPGRVLLLVPDGTGGSGQLLIVIRAGRAGSRRRAAER